jgi:hypothetical protein
LGTQKEMDDIRDWWKIEATRVKDELYAKICDSVGAEHTRTYDPRCALAHSADAHARSHAHAHAGEPRAPVRRLG